jgi:hypothetical protein
LFLIGLARIAWRLLGYVSASLRRFLLAGGLLLAYQTTDVSALDLAFQAPMPSHQAMAASLSAGVLLVFAQGWFCPWSRTLRRRLRTG